MPYEGAKKTQCSTIHCCRFGKESEVFYCPPSTLCLYDHILAYALFLWVVVDRGVFLAESGILPPSMGVARVLTTVFRPVAISRMGRKFGRDAVLY